MNRSVFFAQIRKSLFGGRLTQEQVEGLDRILDYQTDKWPMMPVEELAYVLATVKWETGHSMQPVREAGGSSKRYSPYYGRGLVQITWEVNYKKFGIVNPDDALEWPVALRCLFEGMIKGSFTGKKLSDYITPEKQDYVGARRIVNGTDRADTISGYAVKFLAALRAAEGIAPAPADDGLKQVGNTIGGAGAGAAIGGAATGAEPQTLVVMLVVALLVAGVLYSVSKFRKPKAVQKPADAAPMPEPKAAPSLDADRSVNAVLAKQLEVAELRDRLKAANDELTAARSKLHDQIEELRKSYVASGGELGKAIEELKEIGEGHEFLGGA